MLRTADHRGKERRQRRPRLRGKQVSLLVRTPARGHARDHTHRHRGVRIHGSARTRAQEWACISSLQYPAVPYSLHSIQPFFTVPYSILQHSALSVRLVRSCIFDATEIPKSCNCRTELEKQVRPARTTCPHNMPRDVYSGARSLVSQLQPHEASR